MGEVINARWLPLIAAAKYSSIGENRLIKLAKAGKIKGGQDPDDKRGRWIFDRKSIDRYRESQMPEIKDHQEKALEILHRAGLKS